MRRSTLKTRNRARQALRLAAQAVSRSHHSLGAFYRRMRARLGPKAAIVATAHTLARMVYHLLRHRLAFRDFSAADDEQRAREREIASLRNKAANARALKAPFRAGYAARVRDALAIECLARVHLGHILTAVGLNVLRLGEWFLETARAKTRLTPCARLMAAGVAA